MSVSSIRPYFSSKLSALNFEEWLDGFADDNIPSTHLDRAFHQKTASATARGINQETFEMVVNHEIRIFLKGFSDPAAAIDQGLVECQTVVAECLKLSDYESAGITGLFFEDFSLEPLDGAQNDNVIVGTIRFSVRVFNCIS